MTVERMRAGLYYAVLLVGGSLGTIAAAPAVPADPGMTAAENQFLSDLYMSVHPPLTAQRLINMGWQACADIRNGVSPDVERDNLAMGLLNQGVTTDTASVGTLIHFALRDLCPDVPNTTGI